MTLLMGIGHAERAVGERVRYRLCVDWRRIAQRDPEPVGSGQRGRGCCRERGCVVVVYHQHEMGLIAGLVPDELMLQIIKAELDRLRGKSWILDGFPRTLQQGELLDGVLNEEGRPLNMIVHLNVPDQVIMARIEGESTIGHSYGRKLRRSAMGTSPFGTSVQHHVLCAESTWQRRRDGGTTVAPTGRYACAADVLGELEDMADGAGDVFKTAQSIL